MADARVAAIDATASLQNLTKISRPRHPGMTGRVGFEQIKLRVDQPYILRDGRHSSAIASDRAEIPIALG